MSLRLDSVSLRLLSTATPPPSLDFTWKSKDLNTTIRQWPQFRHHPRGLPNMAIALFKSMQKWTHQISKISSRTQKSSRWAKIQLDGEALTSPWKVLGSKPSNTELSILKQKASFKSAVQLKKCTVHC